MDTENKDKLKRKHSAKETNENDNKKIKTSDIEVLKEMQNKLSGYDLQIKSEVDSVRQKYYVSYFKKVLKELPACNNIIDLDSIEEDREGFFKTFSIAKTCVNSHLELKKIMAFNAAFDMLNGVVSKYIHDKYISPCVKNFITENSLNNAFAKYQETLRSEDKFMELQITAYALQAEFEKNEPLKVPNPIFNRMTQQISAVSKYFIEILKSIAMKPYNGESHTVNSSELIEIK